MGTHDFHPIITQWFHDQLGQPTDVQTRAWPPIAAGEHVLVTAPTGTGKTLAAFLVALDRLLTGQWPGGRLSVLYLSPLKALNNDVRRNLLLPLDQLTSRFREQGVAVPQIGVMVRSGDTPEDERRKFRRRPPEILITTPESLNILLTQPGAGTLFAGLQAVIVDEIHAIVGSKRGTALFLALERLTEIAGEFQRIGLSATVNPPELVARVLAGFDVTGTPRALSPIVSSSAKAYEVQVVLPEKHPDPDDTGKVFWESLALELRKRVRDRASTLIFANSRRACEKLARLMNENQDHLVAYSHHGSLSKEIRLEVETRLKEGDLQALVATNSLELGIDVGNLDEVILAQTPRSAASAIQKVGRAGHRTGEVSRARLYPSHGTDLVEAAVIVRCIRDQAVEPVVVPEGPLDVLAQSILSAVCCRPMASDALYSLVKRAWSYRNLDRRAFDLVMEMLGGRYAGTRIPELKPRIEVDPITGLWTAKQAVPFLLYSSGGTIPNRGYFTLRDVRTGTPLGELDEEFVWERTLGDRFALGAQVWKIAAIDDQAVRVEPIDAPPHIIPFWKAEEQDRSWFLSERIGQFLQEADRALGVREEAWKASLTQSEGFSPEAADRLVGTLKREKDILGALPHRWRIVVEQVAPEKPTDTDRTDVDQYVIHTFWGARVNRPWAFAIAQAWEDQFGYALETYPGDDQILILVPPETKIEEALSLVTPTSLEGLLRRRLEATGFFGARFREGAGRALLLPKAGFDKRMPLWQTRLKAKRLLEAVSGFPEFPILLEAWRQCLHDEFDLKALRNRIDERISGQIETWHCRTDQPSPFTEGLLWRQINEKMYAGDEPPSRRTSQLDPSLWDQLVAGERPKLPRPLVEDWGARWDRTAPGYAPETPADLADLLEVRIALTDSEWRELLEACARDSGRPVQEWECSVPTVHLAGKVGVPSVAELWEHPESLWIRWLENRCPVVLEEAAAFWGQSISGFREWADRRAAEGIVVLGLLTEGAVATELCLTRTWDQMLRRMRLQRRGAVPVRSPAAMPLFLGRWQGLVHPDQGAADLEARVGALLGLPLAADLWEQAVLPSRASPYHSADFDRLFIEGGLRWFGRGPAKVTLGFNEDRELLTALALSPDNTKLVGQIFGNQTEASFSDLIHQSGMTTSALTQALWSLAWEGLVSATSFAPLRQGLRSGFRYDSPAETGRSSSRGLQRWAAARSGAGTWRKWIDISAPSGPMDQMEASKRKARQLLDRYGIVFRSLLGHESPEFQWRAVFPALRLMELSGEVVGGMFWGGVTGLQFASPEALRELEAAGDEQALWIQHAQDPSSLCGMGLDLGTELPRRQTGIWLWWRGQSLVAILGAAGKKLDFLPGAEPEAMELQVLVRRQAGLLFGDGRTHWTLEQLGGNDAADHPKGALLEASGFRRHGEKLILWKSS